MEDERELREEIGKLKQRVDVLESLIRGRLLSRQVEPVTITAESAAETRRETSPTPTAEPAPRDETELEAEIGGNWLNKIGAVALVLGAAFFLKYAFDNRWINEEARIIIGIIAGLACVYGGEHFHKRSLPRYAQGISGAGIAILYLTIFAAFSLYQLIGQLPAFAFMVIVTMTAIALAVRHDSISIAVLGIIGGFLTPVLLRGEQAGGEDPMVRLLSYIAILDLGILGTTYFKNWRSLNLLSFAGTALIFFGWWGEHYTSDKLGLTMLFLTIFFGIFAAQSYVQNVLARRELNMSDMLMAVVAPVLYFAVAYNLLTAGFRMYLGIFAVAIAAVYLAVGQRVQLVAFEDRRLRLLFLCVAGGFLIIAVPIQLEGLGVPIGWAAEGAVLAYIGFRAASPRTRCVGVGLLAVAFIRVITVDTPDAFARQVLHPFANSLFAVYLFVAGMASLVGWLYHRYREAMTPEDFGIRTWTILGANLVMIWALSVQALVLAGLCRGLVVEPGLISLALTIVWIVYAAALVAAGISWRYRPARLMGVVILGIAILKTFTYDISMLTLKYRMVAFVGLGVALLVASYAYQAYRDRIRRFVGGDNAKDGK